MAYTAETWTLTGGSCKANGDQIVLELADHGITATNSSGTITVTASTITSGHLLRRLGKMAKAAGNAKITYTPSTNV